MLVTTMAIGDEGPVLDGLRAEGLHPEIQERRAFPSKGIVRFDVFVVESEVADAMRFLEATGRT